MKPTETAHHGSHGDLDNPAVDHEHSDVNVRAILTFAGIIAAVTIVCAVIVWGLLNTFERMAAARDPQGSPLALPAAPMPGTTASSPYFGSAPEPRLLVDEPTVLGLMRQGEQKQMHGYGWVDEKSGVAHLPIDQAKKLIAERGLPVRAAGVDALLGTHLPAFGEATGGRSISKPAAPGPPATAPAPAPAQPAAPPAKAPAGHGGGA